MSFVRPITNLTKIQLRPLSTTARAYSISKPLLTQGHATKKDIQSSAVRGGSQNKNEARQNPTGQGEEQPFDAARQGNTGGETKSAEGTGSFKDQVGGQGAGGVKKGAAEDASGESYTDMAKNLLSGNFGKGAKVGPLGPPLQHNRADSVLARDAHVSSKIRRAILRRRTKVSRTPQQGRRSRRPEPPFEA